MSAELLTQDTVRELFEYHKDGYLIRRCDCGKTKKGDVAGWLDISTGYRRCTIGGKKYRVNRLIWLYHYKELPILIDHEDQDKLNNRINNLRVLTNSENAQNTGNYSTNTSGIKGVYRIKGVIERWRSRIMYNGKSKNLGCFDDFGEAVYARYLAEQNFGWTDAMSPAHKYVLENLL